jgi:hypothetical protein
MQSGRQGLLQTARAPVARGFRMLGRLALLIHPEPQTEVGWGLWPVMRVSSDFEFRAALRDMVADDAVFMYADGRVLDKSQMLNEVAKFPGGYDFHYEDVQFRNFQDSVMLCFRLVYNDSTALDVETDQ